MWISIFVCTSIFFLVSYGLGYIDDTWGTNTFSTRMLKGIQILIIGIGTVGVLIAIILLFAAHALNIINQS